MRVRRSSRLLVVLLLSIALVVGLTGPAGAGVHLTEKQFRRDANLLCRATNVAITQVFEDAFKDVGSGAALPPDQIAAAATGAVQLLRTMLDRVEQLDGPAAFEKQVDRMLDQYRAVTDRIEDDPQIIFDEGGIFGKPDKVAARLGLRRCVQEPSRLER